MENKEHVEPGKQTPPPTEVEETTEIDLNDTQLGTRPPIERPSISDARDSAREFINKMKIFEDAQHGDGDEDAAMEAYLGMNEQEMDALENDPDCEDPEAEVIKRFVAPIHRYQEHLKQIEGLLLEDTESEDLKHIRPETMDDIIEIGRELEKYSISYTRLLNMFFLSTDPIKMMTVDTQQFAQSFADERKSFIQHGEEAKRLSLRFLNATRESSENVV